MHSNTVLLPAPHSTSARVTIHRCPGAVTLVQQGQRPNLYVKNTGARGPVGPAGSPGAIDSELLSAGAVPIYSVISALNGAAGLADLSVVASGCAVVGVSLNSVSVLGDTVRFRSLGSVGDPAWSWTPNGPIYVSPSGAITQTPPALTGAEWTKVIGHAISATSIFVNLEPTIFLN
jgi:hypothetical protein